MISYVVWWFVLNPEAEVSRLMDFISHSVPLSDTVSIDWESFILTVFSLEMREGQKGCGDMARTVGIGKQDFENIREKRSFIWIRQNSSVNGGRARMM